MSEFLHNEEENKIIKTEQYHKDIVDILHLSDKDELGLVNTEQYLSGEKRFLFGFLNNKNEQNTGFIKYAEDIRLISQLERESKAVELFDLVGLPVVKVQKQFNRTEKSGAVCFETLDSKNGMCLEGSELVANADPVLGERAAKIMLLLYSKKVPKDIDTSYLKRNADMDERCRSEDDFWKSLQTRIDKILNSDFGKINKAFLANDERIIDKNELIDIIKQTKTSLEEIIPQGRLLNEEYLIHGDTAPSNTYFSNHPSAENPDRLLDLEHCSAVKNSSLAFLIDVGNYGARLWANKEMRINYYNTILNEVKSEERDRYYKLLKTTIIFNTLDLAHYGMDSNHKEHIMSVKLLSQLKSILSALDENYLRLKNL